MTAFHPRSQDLPEITPVFPLAGALLLPHGKLPLNIFEPRYLALVEDALAAGRMFGMIQPDPRRPPGQAGPALYSMGCLGRLSSFSETEDGRFLITLTGLIRFTVVEEMEMRHGYRRLRVAYRAHLTDLDVQKDTPEDSVPRETDRASLLKALRAYFVANGIDANWDAINQMPYGQLVISLCMACPFAPEEKQALLQAVTAADRAASLLTLLQIDSHSPPQTGSSPPGPPHSGPFGGRPS
jgi:Lon protease-like protein